MHIGKACSLDQPNYFIFIAYRDALFDTAAHLFRLFSGDADSLDGLDDPGWNEGEAPNVVGRQRFGRITIANSDSGAAGSTGVAIEQGLRAVRELG